MGRVGRPQGRDQVCLRQEECWEEEGGRRLRRAGRVGRTRRSAGGPACSPAGGSRGAGRCGCLRRGASKPRAAPAAAAGARRAARGVGEAGGARGAQPAAARGRRILGLLGEPRQGGAAARRHGGGQSRRHRRGPFVAALGARPLACQPGAAAEPSAAADAGRLQPRAAGALDRELSAVPRRARRLAAPRRGRRARGGAAGRRRRPELRGASRPRGRSSAAARRLRAPSGQRRPHALPAGPLPARRLARAAAALGRGR
mmetsp:Transcript_1974/g.6443  ORF Transcript_1974/g.6443 Transcript_1974/m.6443 type:complete len:258 (+) Transcript_1974:297-1070(+)